TNTSYLTIIKVALVPAIMYYVTVLFFVHYEAKKFGLVGQPKENLPRVGKVIKEGLHFIIPVLILIYVLVNNYSPMMAGFVAVISTLAASLAANAVRWAVAPQQVEDGKKRSSAMAFAVDELKSIVRALEKGAKNAIMVSVACAAAGIIVGMVTLTGMGLKFSSLVLDLSYGIKVLAILLIGAASLVLGMGLPVTASYIVLATLAGPALLDMGVPLMVSHMIVFWYSQDANVTPPVSLASFAGAGVAGANPMRTAFTSWKLAKGLYIIPIIMAYRPLLGMGTGYELSAGPPGRRHCCSGSPPQVFSGPSTGPMDWALPLLPRSLPCKNCPHPADKCLGATPKTGQKTSKTVDLFISEALSKWRAIFVAWDIPP
ncbi:MAG: TRAP transporter large permease subunit, partial [Desulfosarcina sp.]|nr:TRAP transporter large permease subunit [Desulfosarcina sp.]